MWLAAERKGVAELVSAFEFCPKESHLAGVAGVRPRTAGVKLRTAFLQTTPGALAPDSGVETETNAVCGAQEAKGLAGCLWK